MRTDDKQSIIITSEFSDNSHFRRVYTRRKPGNNDQHIHCNGVHGAFLT